MMAAVLVLWYSYSGPSDPTLTKGMCQDVMPQCFSGLFNLKLSYLHVIFWILSQKPPKPDQCDLNPLLSWPERRLESDDLSCVPFRELPFKLSVHLAVTQTDV